MPGRSVSFTHAISRTPSTSIVDGLRAEDRGAPDANLFLNEHEAYVAALEDAGVAVTVLEPLEDYPDSVFVEDPALILSGVAILLRPGAPSRAGEAAAIRPALEAQCDGLIELTAGYVDGGDVLCTDDTVMVGDFLYDLEAGKGAGVMTIHVDTRGTADYPSVTDIRVEGLGDIINYLKG